MEFKKVSLMVFYNNQNKILLQERKDFSRFGEEWGFFGGEVEEGESPEQALKREIMEELNFEVKEAMLILNFKHWVAKEKLAERFVFIAPVRDNFKKFRLSEGSGMEWFSLEEAEKLKMMPGDELILKKLKKTFERKN